MESDKNFKYNQKEFNFQIRTYKQLVQSYQEQLKQEDTKEQRLKMKKARAARRFLKDLDS